MKVLIIDPWGIKNTADYLDGLIYGLSPLIELTVFCNYYYKKATNSMFNIHPIFFKKSEMMKPGLIRKFTRGLEYFKGYYEIITNLKNCPRFDVIHTNWLLFYKLDIIFLKFLKKHCYKLVYTAHNAIPHIKGNKSIPQLRKIYSIVDNIIVHGQQIEKELAEVFPIAKGKIYIQRHGFLLKKPYIVSLTYEEQSIVKKCEEFNKVLIFFGLIFPSKGIDRVVSLWIDKYRQYNALLIIAGKTITDYPQMEQLKKEIYRTNNILYLNHFVEDSLLNALISKSDIILLPYKHASMSGVVFVAAQFKKTILFTDSGSLNEYLNSGQDSIVCENTNDGIDQGLLSVINSDRKLLASMGERLQLNIQKKCDWKDICKALVESVYINKRIVMEKNNDNHKNTI